MSLGYGNPSDDAALLRSRSAHSKPAGLHRSRQMQAMQEPDPRSYRCGGSGARGVGNLWSWRALAHPGYTFDTASDCS